MPKEVIGMAINKESNLYTVRMAEGCLLVVLSTSSIRDPLIVLIVSPSFFDQIIDGRGAHY